MTKSDAEKIQEQVKFDIACGMFSNIANDLIMDAPADHPMTEQIEEVASAATALDEAVTGYINAVCERLGVDPNEHAPRGD